MTDSTFTVPAMRDTAEHLRAEAAKLIAEAEIKARQHVEAARMKAEDMRMAAAEIDADADRKQADRGARQQRPETPAIGSMAHCPGCRQPVAWDGLGWTHATATDCTADLTGIEAQQDGGA